MSVSDAGNAGEDARELSPLMSSRYVSQHRAARVPVCTPPAHRPSRACSATVTVVAAAAAAAAVTIPARYLRYCIY